MNTPMTSEFLHNVELTARAVNAVNAQLRTGLIGTDEMARLVTDSYFGGFHLLIEGVPGVGKTETAKRLAPAVAGVAFGRIQGNPDVQPMDMIGYERYSKKTDDYEDHLNVLSTSDVVLVDELNRVKPNSQSALYDAMSDGTVVIGRRIHNLKEHFFVVGTQNPHETGMGTFPISNPLRDRFGASLFVGSPSENDRLAVLRARNARQHLQTPTEVIQLDHMDRYKGLIGSISVEDTGLQLIANFFEHIRQNDTVEMKADGHRGGIATMELAKARAVREGKSQATVEDVKAVLPYTARHRFELDSDAKSEQLEAEKQEIIQDSIKKAA